MEGCVATRDLGGRKTQTLWCCLCFCFIFESDLCTLSCISLFFSPLCLLLRHCCPSVRLVWGWRVVGMMILRSVCVCVCVFIWMGCGGPGDVIFFFFVYLFDLFYGGGVPCCCGTIRLCIQEGNASAVTRSHYVLP